MSIPSGTFAELQTFILPLSGLPTEPCLSGHVPPWPSVASTATSSFLSSEEIATIHVQTCQGSNQRMKDHRRVRSPRFVVPNNEQAVLSIGAEKLKGTLRTLSLTGGTIRLDRRFASGTFADIGIQTASGTFSAAIELLPMASGNAQAFRFIAMGPVARGRLNDGLSKMRAQGLALKKTPLDQFRSLARRVLSARSAK
jgi:hypothetical protein